LGLKHPDVLGNRLDEVRLFPDSRSRCFAALFAPELALLLLLDVRRQEAVLLLLARLGTKSAGNQLTPAASLPFRAETNWVSAFDRRVPLMTSREK
jgi:hypothetical protein